MGSERNPIKKAKLETNSESEDSNNLSLNPQIKLQARRAYPTFAANQKINSFFD
ncbi:hypothetical protein LDG_7946 [Legionella drancourtii LLAP12]|uniref:Uncharacterized protein n=1 Tax=Legionella drancourtii LLAP12 TaxID=658187 RepID=G9ERM9_9GAMM|nr:hypothetical protein LDG_7946 [Legionella drancourtii LLAP12]